MARSKLQGEFLYRVYTIDHRLWSTKYGYHAIKHSIRLTRTLFKDETSAFMKQKCDQIHEAREDGSILARGVAKLMEFLKQRGGTKSKIVYIATPVAEEETVNAITDWLNRNCYIFMIFY